MECRHCESHERIIDDLLWVLSHQNDPRTKGIVLRARAHNAAWHEARSMQDKVVNLRESPARKVAYEDTVAYHLEKALQASKELARLACP